MKKATKAVKAIFGRSSKGSKNDESRKSSPLPIKAPPPATASTISEAGYNTHLPLPTRTWENSSSQSALTASNLGTVESVDADSGRVQIPDKVEEDPVQASELVPRRSAPLRSVLELEEAIKEFKKNYSQFAKKNQKYFLIDEDLENAFPNEITNSDIKYTAKVLEESIWKTRQIAEKKKSIVENTWTGQVNRFFAKLYPVARLSCGLMGAIADGASFAPLKGATSGLGIILQILEDESGRSDDFLVQLRRIEFQAALLADNPSYDLSLEVTQNLLRESSTELLSAVIKFLNSALLYLSSGFFANLWKTSVNGTEIYTAGKEQLNNAILQYDQAVMHLTAHVVASMRYERGKYHNADFLQWLSPSYWDVESYLTSFRQQRSDGTLGWARDMPEFQAWRLSDLEERSERRITWMHGTLGIGKSIMAAYFIDLLKCQYPNAVVAYFFCRSNQPGLTSARDILRTLAYQCIENDKTARAVLEELRSKGFQINEKLGIRFLFDKLLLEPLRNTKEIYIVLDGLDEADMLTKDHTDRSGRPELHILLACLAKLPSSRLLCISRPNANISKILKNVFAKVISKEDNAKDIDSYVQKIVSESETLRSLFKACYVNPTQYFRDKGNGIFLWVVLVLQQLEKAESSLIFQRYLRGFSDASGSMEKLYSTILIRIDDDYRQWVREIIRWLFAAEEVLSVKSLKSLVEWCLQPDTLVDFKRFLEVNCGSIVHILPDEDGDAIVTLIHETFRSFIANPDVCPQPFLIDETEIHGYIALKCVQSLMNPSASEECDEYTLCYWVDHLAKATSTQHSKQLLSAVHQLFTSRGLTTWIKWLCNDSSPNLQTSVETGSLRDIVQWLRTRAVGTAVEPSVEGGHMNTQVEVAINWRSNVLKEPSILGEAMGKAAAAIWLHESLTECSIIFGCFSLAIKYYWRRTNRLKSNLAELKDLVATKFRDIYIWAARDDIEIPIVNTNIGLALYVLYRWDECIDFLNSKDGLSDDIPYVRRYLALSYMAKRDYDGVIQLLENHYEYAPDLLIRAYKFKREYDTPIKIFQNAYTTQSPTQEAWFSLYNAYEAKGDHNAMIEMLESPLSKKVFERNESRLWGRMFNIYSEKGWNATAVAKFQAVVDENPHNTYSWLNFGLLYRRWGDHDGAIGVFEQGILECPDYSLYQQLVRAYMAKGDNSRAIQTLKLAMERFSMHGDTYLLSQAYTNKADHDGLIKELSIIVDKYPTFPDPWLSLGEAHMKKENYDNAIKVYKMAIEGPEFSGWYLNELLQSLFTAYTKKHDYSKAIEVFKSKAKLDASNSEFWLSGLFDIYEALHDYGGAIKAFEAIIDAGDDRVAWVWPYLLKAAAAKGDYESVLEKLEDAFGNSRLEPSADIGYAIFDVYKARGDYEEGALRFNEIVNSLPLESWTWHILGETYKAKGDYEKAIEVYHGALEQISNDYSFYKCLCDLYLSIFDYPQVIEYYQKAKIFAEDSFQWAYLQIRSWKFEITIDGFLREHFLWHSVGEAYRKLGDSTRASELYCVAASVYEAAINKDYNGLSWLHRGVHLDSDGTPIDVFNDSDLPAEVLWFAAGEAYKANGDIKSALKAFVRAYTLKPQNTYLHDLVSDLERTLEYTGDGDNVATSNSESSPIADTEGGARPTALSI